MAMANIIAAMTNATVNNTMMRLISTTFLVVAGRITPPC